MKHHVKFNFLALTKKTSMSLGNQNGWFTDTVNAPPKE